MIVAKGPGTSAPDEGNIEMMGGWMEMGNWYGPVSMLAWWGGLAALVAWAITRVTRGHVHGHSHGHHGFGAHAAPETARAILDRRLASGEIDAESYARARRLIEEPVTPATGA